MEGNRLCKVSAEGVIPVKTMSQKKSNISKEGPGISRGPLSPGKEPVNN